MNSLFIVAVCCKITKHKEELEGEEGKEERQIKSESLINKEKEKVMNLL
jgi:hypothetical protein